VTAENKAADNTPLYSPDGNYIAYRAQQRPGYESDRWRLMLHDRKTGERRNLTEAFDKWVGTFAWHPDSSSVFFAADRAGQSPIYRRAIAGNGKNDKAQNDVELVFGAEGYKDGIVITPDGRNLLFTQMSIRYPGGIYVGDIEYLKENPWLRSFNAICSGQDPKGCTVEEPIGTVITHIND